MHMALLSRLIFTSIGVTLPIAAHLADLRENVMPCRVMRSATILGVPAKSSCTNRPRRFEHTDESRF